MRRPAETVVVIGISLRPDCAVTVESGGTNLYQVEQNAFNSVVPFCLQQVVKVWLQIINVKLKVNGKPLLSRAVADGSSELTMKRET